MAYAGKLWSCSSDKTEAELFADAMENLFGIRSKKLFTVLRAVSEKILDNETPVTLSALLTESCQGFDYAGYEMLSLQKSALEEILPEVKSDIGTVIINDIIDSCYYNILKCRLQKATRILFNPLKDNEKAKQDISAIYNEVKAFSVKRIEKWHKYRSGITPCNIENMYAEYLKLIKSLPELARENGIMKIRFCLPDGFSAEYCKISLKFSGSWQEIHAGLCKGTDPEGAFFTKAFLVDKSSAPEAFRLEASGYGGQGLAFVEVVNAEGSFVPSAVLSASGKVIDSEHVLDNDSKWSFIGEKDTFKAYTNRKLAEEIHSVEYSLVKINNQEQ
jgi:hypothetical protein